MQMPLRDSLPRNNPQIYRLAKWLYNHDPEYKHRSIVVCFDHLFSWDKNRWYDMAAELLKKIELKEFTGKDNHE